MLADTLELRTRPWLNYESGVIIPATVIRRFIDVTKADPVGLLTAGGPPCNSPPRNED
jgi:hypothetical protein